MAGFLHNAFAVTKVALARARFLAVFLAAAMVVGYWDHIKNYMDKWTRPPVAPDALTQAAGDVEYYCVMHPNVVRSEPGNCPICGMPLAKRKKGEKMTLPGGVLARVQLTPWRIAMANIQTSVVQERNLARDIRSVATVDYDETRVAQISSRVPGRADELYVRSVGQEVKRGDPLYSLYSPEVYTAQREYLLARKRVNDLPKDAAEDLKMDTVDVYNASTQKLALWGMTEKDFAELDEAFDKTGKVPTHFVATSPISGIVVKKNLYEGGYVQTGDTPFTVADISNLWLQVRIYEQDVPLVHLGDQVAIHIDSLPNETFAGKITYLAFQLDPATRTLAARVEVANTDKRLRPGMFAEVNIRVPVLAEKQDDLGGEGATMNATSYRSRMESAALALVSRDTVVMNATRFRGALESYFAAQMLLAQDKVEGVPELLRDAAKKLEAIKGDADVAARVEKIAKLAQDSASRKLKELRDSYREISAEMIELGLAVGVPEDGQAVKVFHCPMGVKPNWLQLGNEALNPFMGTEMPTCGSEINRLPRVAAPVATRPVTSGSHVLALPRSAVIDTGRSMVVFVANATMEGVFDMRSVKVGPLAGDWYPVVAGLEEGDRVVTTGAFLLDAENRLNPVEAEEAVTQPATTSAPATSGPATQHAHDGMPDGAPAP